MKAKLSGSFPSKNSKTGYTHKYVITGTDAEIAKLVESTNFKEYPLYDEVTGEPIVFRNEPMISNPCDVGINPKNNMYYLSDASIIGDIARVSKLEKLSVTMAQEFAKETVQELKGLDRFRKMAQVIEETKQEEQPKK